MMRNEKPGGHGERSVAVGVLDMAIWDAVAKIAERPLADVLAERHGVGPPDDSVAVYAAGGYYHAGKGLHALQDEMRRYLDLGYKCVKIKIGGAPLEEDIARVEAVIDVVGEASAVAVDANGRLGPDRAMAYADALAPYRLMWYEEPGDPLDYALQAAIAERYLPPLATGENLFSIADTRNLIRYAGLRPELVEYLGIMTMLNEHGWSARRCVPHGGHQLALLIAAALGTGGSESYPGIFQPFGGFADSTPIIDGLIKIPDTPGIGFEAKTSLYKLLSELASGTTGSRC